MLCLASVGHHACVQPQRRLASATDAEFGHNVHHRAYRDVVERQFGVWNVAAQDAFFRDGWNAAAHEIVECDGVPVGYISVEDRSDLVHVRELVLLPEFQNRGIGTEATRAMVRHGFFDLNLHRIYVSILQENASSIRMCEKAGFRHEGTIREGAFKNGKYHDLVLMGVLRSEVQPGDGR